MNHCQLFPAVLVASIVFIGCGKPQSGSPPTNTTNGSPQQHVSLLLNWFPEAEHGGFYAARLRGFFTDEGLDVAIQPGGPKVPVIQMLDSGRVDFAVMNADRVVFARAQGVDIVAVMTAMQHTPRCIMVHRSSGIEKLEQLRDVTLAVGSGPAFYRFMARHLPLENVKTVSYPGSIGPFLANPRFAQQAYVFSEPFLAQQKGAEPVCLMLSELGYDPYASLLVARGAMIREQPELVRKMVRASVLGWRHYLAEPTSTNSFICGINSEMNGKLLEFGAREIEKLSLSPDEDDGGFGAMTLARWTTLVRQLEETELIEAGSVQPDATFTMQFLGESSLN